MENLLSRSGQIQNPNSFFGGSTLKLVYRHSTLKQTKQVKNPNWQEANQLAILYKRSRGVDPRSKDYQLVVRAGPELEISRFQVRHPDHSATLLQIERDCFSLAFLIFVKTRRSFLQAQIFKDFLWEGFIGLNDTFLHF